MKHLFVAMVAIAFSLFSPTPSQAQDAFGVCETGEAQCQALMIEVKKVQLAEELQMARPTLNPSFLCTQDNPNCCPPELMPLCMAHAGQILDQTVLSLAVQAEIGPCPFSAAICDSLGAFYCGPDAGWNPWDGCTEIAELPPLPPLPPVCEATERWNGKICIPVPCFDRRFGIEIPCGPISDGQIASRDFESVRKLTGMLQENDVTTAAREALQEQAKVAMDGVSQ